MLKLCLGFLLRLLALHKASALQNFLKLSKKIFSYSSEILSLKLAVRFIYKLKNIFKNKLRNNLMLLLCTLKYISLVLRRRALRSERVFRNQSDSLEKFNDFELIERYRFDRISIIYLHDLSKDHMSPTTHRNCDLSL